MFCHTCTTSAGNRNIKETFILILISPLAIPCAILRSCVAIDPHVIFAFSLVDLYRVNCYGLFAMQQKEVSYSPT